jgi:hypothetical protein
VTYLQQVLAGDCAVSPSETSPARTCMIRLQTRFDFKLFLDPINRPFAFCIFLCSVEGCLIASLLIPRAAISHCPLHHYALPLSLRYKPLWYMQVIAVCCIPQAHSCITWATIASCPLLQDPQIALLCCFAADALIPLSPLDIDPLGNLKLHGLSPVSTAASRSGLDPLQTTCCMLRLLLIPRTPLCHQQLQITVTCGCCARALIPGLAPGAPLACQSLQELLVPTPCCCVTGMHSRGTPRSVAGQTQLVLVLVTAVTRAVSPVLQPVLGERPSRALLTVDRYMLPPCLFALRSVGCFRGF